MYDSTHPETIEEAREIIKSKYHEHPNEFWRKRTNLIQRVTIITETLEEIKPKRP